MKLEVPTTLQEKRSAAGQKGGAARSAAKQQAARENGQKGGYSGVPGGRPLLPLSQILCTCGREDGTHASQCRRYQTQKKRESRQNQSV